ncbi:MAG: ribonuclease III family protein [Candidatus Heimdallarchaeota archaeon]
MDTPTPFASDLRSILSNKDYSRFGDSIVNFIYNAAIFEVTQHSRGVKVWDSCLAQACRNSQLRKYLGTRKNAGDIGDAVEAFVAYVYLKNKNTINEMIMILSKNLNQNKKLLQTQEKELCAESFTLLINVFCEKLGILP